MKKSYGIFTFTLLALATATPALAAQPVDLSHQPFSVLSTRAFHTLSTAGSQVPAAGFKQISSHVDAKQTTHIRIQQTLDNIPVWGGDAVLHIPAAAKNLGHMTFNTLMAHPAQNTRMNGTIYKNLQADLTVSPAKAYSAESSAAAMKAAVSLWLQKAGAKSEISSESIQPMIFVDKNSKAHWAYKIRFMAQVQHMHPAIPVFLMDALTHEVYLQWNDLKTAEANGGGFGGNPRMGKLVYDGLKNSLPPLTMTRNDTTQTCSLENTEVRVKDRNRSNGDKVPTFACTATDATHNNVYWNEDFKSTNGGFSPDNDALFIGHVVQKIYNEWYGIPALVNQDGSPMQLVMRVHDYEYPDNAFWDGQQMTFGDGSESYYPFTILNIGAHEISHGFTEQHSNLIYQGQSGGLNESFSDMAGAAADYYAYGTNTWQLGAEIVKDPEGTPFRYMDQPSKDCHGMPPGMFCSIDKADQYNDWLDVHFSSGVFNRAFYLISTTSGWDPHKAFDVMVKANQDYWTSSTNFEQAACGVMHATTDLGYDTKAVHKALATVGLETIDC